MDNSTVTPLEGELLIINQLDLLSSTTVAGALYGLAFALFCLYVHAIGRQLREGERTRQAKFMLAYSIVVMICGTYYLVASAWVAQDAYIKHSDYPDSPYSYVISTYPTSPVIWLALACQQTVDALTSAIQVCRRFFPCIYSTMWLNSVQRFGGYGSFGMPLHFPIW
jgi:hypothetical protein